ncbi:hypothetical protein OUZ56_023821 [Daphnia magna]|uniref:Peptidase aspartic putative domain-containing protein n=1 Tax=Daphnia magna TaxID=35525 RepID=A0ABR0AZM6_9CRUS|nr:hypothetical protein OUZ56_023821 [Daphnia magna]
MTPTRATLKDLAKWIDEMVMGELMTRPSTHRLPAPQKEKKAEGAKPSTKPTPLFATKNTVQSAAKSSDGRAITIKNRDSAINTSLVIVPVLLQANGVEIEIFVFLDPGATVYLIREDIAKQLKCKGNAKNVSFGSFYGQDPQFQSTTVSLTVKACDRSFEADLKQVSTVPTQYLKLPCPPKGLPPIGTDAPFGLLTPFGWTCVGDLTLGTQQHYSTVCRSNKPLLTVQKLCYHVQESPNEALLLRQIEKLWETESFPIVTPAQPLESTED